MNLIRPPGTWTLITHVLNQLSYPAAIKVNAWLLLLQFCDTHSWGAYKFQQKNQSIQNHFSQILVCDFIIDYKWELNWANATSSIKKDLRPAPTKWK